MSNNSNSNDDDSDNSEGDNLSPLQRHVKHTLENATNVAEAMAYRFEYHIFHCGNVHRIGRVAHEDIMGLIGEWCFEHNREILEFPTRPVHVFMEGVLTRVYTFKAMSAKKMIFDEVSVLFGLYGEPVVEEEPRVFEK